VTVFEIDNLYGMPSPKILGTFAFYMFDETSVDIRGNPGVERII
jgi:hypothetical protein